MDYDQRVFQSRPVGTKCSNRWCPYNDNAYSSRGAYDGLCLNCIDDDRQDREFADNY